MTLNLAEVQQKVDRLLANMAEKDRAFESVYFSDTPADVSLELYDDDGDLNTITIPNRAKVIQDTIMPAGYSRDVAWETKGTSAADRLILLSPDNLWLDIGGTGYRLTTQVEVNLALSVNWDSGAPDYTQAGNRAGKDFYVYACVPTSGTTPDILLSANASYPTGYTADNSRKIAGFHCLCADINHNSSLTAWAASATITEGETRKATTWDGYLYRCTTMGGGTAGGSEPTWSGAAVGDTIADGDVTWIKEEHALEGYLAGDILPASVWDLSHRPVCSPEGMLWSEASQLWIDIYLQSGTGASTASAYGGTITDTRTWISHVDDLGAAGKRLLDDMSFQLAAKGSNEQSSYATVEATIPTTTGGHEDTYGRRMVSDIGLEDMVGNRVQVLTEIATWLLSETLSVAALVSTNRGILMGYGITADVFINDAGLSEAPTGSFSWGQMRAGGHWFLKQGGGSCCRTTTGGDRMAEVVYVSARGCAPSKIH